MKSAFGIEHTVSKGLPSSLRGSGKVKGLYGQHLKAANTYGQDNARMASSGFGGDGRTLAQGMNQKAKARRIQIQSANKKKKRVLP